VDTILSLAFSAVRTDHVEGVTTRSGSSLSSFVVVRTQDGSVVSPQGHIQFFLLWPPFADRVGICFLVIKLSTEFGTYFFS